MRTITSALNAELLYQSYKKILDVWDRRELIREVRIQACRYAQDEQGHTLHKSVYQKGVFFCPNCGEKQ